MLQASFSGKAALIAQQHRMDVTSNNLANVNTNGFKSSRVNFKDMMYTTMIRPEDPQDMNLQEGTGVMVSSIDYDLSQGVPMMTGMPLDVCLDGEGFFTVTNARGQTLYTRDGAFAASVEEDGRYLVTAQGYYVMDNAGNRIRLPEGELEAIGISGQGDLSFGTDAPFATLGIVNFDNPYGLSSVSNNCYMETVASGGPVAADVTVRQRYLENSNVDLASEMVAMIRASRAFSFASRAVTTADEMQATANNMRS